MFRWGGRLSCQTLRSRIPQAIRSRIQGIRESPMTLLCLGCCGGIWLVFPGTSHDLQVSPLRTRKYCHLVLGSPFFREVLESVLTGVGDPTNVAEKDPLVVVKFFFRLEALGACDTCLKPPFTCSSKSWLSRPSIVGNFLLQRQVSIFGSRLFVRCRTMDRFSHQQKLPWGH